MNEYVRASRSPQENWFSVATAHFLNGDYSRALEAAEIVLSFNCDHDDSKDSQLYSDCQNLIRRCYLAPFEQLIANGQRAEASRLLTHRIRQATGEEKAELKKILATLPPNVKNKR